MCNKVKVSKTIEQSRCSMSLSFPPLLKNNFRIWLKNVKFSNQICLLLMIDIKKNSSSEGFVLLRQKGLPKIGVTTYRWSPVKIGILQDKQKVFGNSLNCCKIVTHFLNWKRNTFSLLSWDIQWDRLLWPLE